MSPASTILGGAPDAERRALRAALIAALVCWAWVAIPLVAGRDTLFLRDVLGLHFPLKAFGAEQLREGRIPALNPSVGARPTVPRQPQRAAPSIRATCFYLCCRSGAAFNAPLRAALAARRCVAMRALARGLGQSPRRRRWSPASPTRGGGFMLSALIFYNLLAVAGVVAAGDAGRACAAAAGHRGGRPRLRHGAARRRAGHRGAGHGAAGAGGDQRAWLAAWTR